MAHRCAFTSGASVGSGVSSVDCRMRKSVNAFIGCSFCDPSKKASAPVQAGGARLAAVSAREEHEHSSQHEQRFQRAERPPAWLTELVKYCMTPSWPSTELLALLVYLLEERDLLDSTRVVSAHYSTLLE